MAIVASLPGPRNLHRTHTSAAARPRARENRDFFSCFEFIYEILFFYSSLVGWTTLIECTTAQLIKICWHADKNVHTHKHTWAHTTVVDNEILMRTYALHTLYCTVCVDGSRGSRFLCVRVRVRVLHYTRFVSFHLFICAADCLLTDCWRLTAILPLSIIMFSEEEKKFVTRIYSISQYQRTGLACMHTRTQSHAANTNSMVRCGDNCSATTSWSRSLSETSAFRRYVSLLGCLAGVLLNFHKFNFGSHYAFKFTFIIHENVDYCSARATQDVRKRAAGEFIWLSCICCHGHWMTITAMTTMVMVVVAATTATYERTNYFQSNYYYYKSFSQSHVC